MPFIFEIEPEDHCFLAACVRFHVWAKHESNFDDWASKDLLMAESECLIRRGFGIEMVEALIDDFVQHRDLYES